MAKDYTVQSLLGRHLSFSITGRLSPFATAAEKAAQEKTVTITGRLDSAYISLSKTTEDISCVQSPWENQLWVRKGGTLELNEILRAVDPPAITTGKGGILFYIWTNFDTADVVISRKSVVWTFRGTPTAYSERLVADKNIGSMTMVLRDVGAVNPGYTVATPPVQQ